MWAVRDQENLIHNQQTIAAAKPLNQGVKALNPKTPGNKGSKTPFKLPLNDENSTSIFGDGKAKLGTNGKGIANQSSKIQSNRPLDKNAFVTPSGPRNRAPLGAKTTNAKAKAFQTPGGPNTGAGKTSKTDRQQQQGVTARKPKIEVKRAESVKVDGLGPVEEAERDVEYMQPYAKPLPDDPDDFPSGLDFSILNPANQSRSFFRYFSGNEEERLRRQEAEREAAFKAQDELMNKKIAEMKFPGIEKSESKTVQRPKAPRNLVGTTQKRKIQVHRNPPIEKPSTLARATEPRITAAHSRQAASLLSTRVAPVALRSKPNGNGPSLPGKKSLVPSSRAGTLPVGRKPSGSTGTISYAKGRAVSKLLASSSTAKRTSGEGQELSEPTEESMLVDFEQKLFARQFAEEDEENTRMRLPIFSELFKEEADDDFQLDISWEDSNGDGDKSAA